MTNRNLLLLALGLIVAGLVGAGGFDGFSMGMGMHRGPMMGWSSSTSNDPIPGAPDVEILADELAFSPDTVVLDPGTPVNIVFTNRGSVLHDLTIPEVGFRAVAGPGETVTVGLEGLEPGEYRFECTIPGHAAAGMVGTLVVGA